MYLPPFGEFADPRRVADLAVMAEQAGWAGLFLWDHMLAVPGLAVADAWTTLAAIAMATRQIRIGALVTPLSRRRPWTLARQISTLDHLASGRLVAGIGLGEDGWKEFSSFGEVVDPRERGLLLDESVEILQACCAVSRSGTVAPGMPLTRAPSCPPRSRTRCRYGPPAAGRTASRWPGRPGCRAASRSSPAAASSRCLRPPITSSPCATNFAAWARPTATTW